MKKNIRVVTISFLLFFLSCSKPVVEEETVEVFGMDETVLERKMEIEIPCNCVQNDFSIVGSEYDEQTCHERGGRGVFKFKGSFEDKLKFKKTRIIKSWDELTRVKKYFDSEALESILQSEFHEHIFGIIIVSYFGFDFLLGEDLYSKDGTIHFGYEIWTYKTTKPIPECIWNNFYIFKFKRE